MPDSCRVALENNQEVCGSCRDWKKICFVEPDIVPVTEQFTTTTTLAPTTTTTKATTKAGVVLKHFYYKKI